MDKITIRNEKLSSFIRTEDAVEGFDTAVDNGQFRLALDILNDMLPSILERIEAIENKIDDVVASNSAVKSTPVKAKSTDKESDSLSDK